MIIHANAGAGHRRAAEALYQEVKAQFSGATIEIFDALEYTVPFFGRNYSRGYLFVVKHLPWLWGLGFYLVNLGPVDWLGKRVRRINNMLVGRRLERRLLACQPELVFTTHFLPNEVITHLKQKHRFQTKLVTCLTDYYPHIWWRNCGVDLYITPSEDLTARLVKLGVDREKIKPLGIPIDPEFQKAHSKEAVREQLGLHPERFTLLVTSGGFGVGPLETLLAEIVKLEIPMQILAVCGNNTVLQENLRPLVEHPVHQIHIFGYVSNMHELMAASDLMVSKSGGLTTTEAMAKGVPMIVLYPIPGQELSNCEFLLKHEAGLRASSTEEAAGQIAALVKAPQRLQRMKENMTALGRPCSAREIVAYVKDLFQ